MVNRIGILTMLFQISLGFQRYTYRQNGVSRMLAHVSSSLDPFLKAAEALLPWERVQKKENEAVLDLSNWNKAESGLALSTMAAVENQSAGNVTSSLLTNVDGSKDNDVDTWKDGEIWKMNREALVDRSILPKNCKSGSIEERKLLEAAPQLIRIHPDEVLASTDAALGLGIPVSLLQSEPRILAYPRKYICEETLNFLSNMMMLGSKDVALSLCKSTPKLFLASVEGYMQETSVSKALGAASDAVYSASKSVATDVSAQVRAQRRKRAS